MSQPFVRPDVRAFLTLLESIPGPKMHELDPPAARLAFGAMVAVAELPAEALAVRRDHATPQGTRLRLYDTRAQRPPGPTLLFFHGGGFVIGDLESHDSFCGEVARALDLPVIAVDYRLAPEHPFPAAPDDCEAVARWVAGNPGELGITTTALVLAGDSAGGNLTIVTTQALRDRPAAVPVIAQWPIYPVVDDASDYPSQQDFADGYLLTAESMGWFEKHYAPAPGDLRNVALRADHAGTPPSLVITAGLDPLRDQGRAYAAALISVGVPTVYREATGNIHGFVNLRKLIPSSQGDIAACLRILKAIIVEAEANRVMAQAAG